MKIVIVLKKVQHSTQLGYLIYGYPAGSGIASMVALLSW